MLTVRKEQIHALARSTSVDFACRMYDHLRADFGDVVSHLDCAGLNAALGKWIGHGNELRLSTEADLELFIELCCCYPEIESEQPPASVETLWARTDLTSHEKLLNIRDMLMFSEDQQ